ncbi:MAG: ABC transporter permease [Clostridiales bacterium]|nr:ABC transporter permease [Clostridiales bacterium]
MEEELAEYNEENGTEEELQLDERTIFTLDNIFKVNDYLPVLFKSLWLAAIATAICLVIAYPMSFAISRGNANRQKVMIMLVMLPMWMNFLLRTYAWMTLLEKNGWINKFLSFLSIGPFQMINTQGAVVLGMVYNYLPFMILPLYSIMVKIQDTTLEASADLGANVFQTFSRVILPLSMPGIATGITMVFVPAISTFIISRMLGGGTNLLIGDLIDLQFLGNAYNPNLGAAISLVLMAFILLCMSITNQLDNEDNIEGVLL